MVDLEKSPPTTVRELGVMLVSHIEEQKDLKCLVELIPDLQSIVAEKKNRAYFDRRAAKIGRLIVIIGGGIATVIGTIYAVAKLIVVLGNTK